jgi:hypothetical protein
MGGEPSKMDDGKWYNKLEGIKKLDSVQNGGRIVDGVDARIVGVEARKGGVPSGVDALVSDGGSICQEKINNTIQRMKKYCIDGCPDDVEKNFEGVSSVVGDTRILVDGDRSSIIKGTESEINSNVSEGFQNMDDRTFTIILAGILFVFICTKNN